MRHESCPRRRLIAILATQDSPLTRRLICPHRPSSPGLAAFLVQARHWSQTLIMPPSASRVRLTFSTILQLSELRCRSRSSSPQTTTGAEDLDRHWLALFSFPKNLLRTLKPQWIRRSPSVGDDHLVSESLVQARRATAKQFLQIGILGLRTSSP